MSVKFKNKKIFDEDNETIKTKELTIDKHIRRRSVSFFLKHAGQEYGFLQLFGLAVMRILCLEKNPYSDGTASQVCVEVINRFFKEVLGVDTGLDSDSAGLREIEEFLDRYCENEVHD